MDDTNTSPETEPDAGASDAQPPAPTPPGADGTVLKDEIASIQAIGEDH
jgi:hypothetical protein